MHEYVKAELARSREQEIARRTRYAFHRAEIEAHRRVEAETQRDLGPRRLAWYAVVRRWLARPRPAGGVRRIGRPTDGDRTGYDECTSVAHTPLL
jgi:hypothetical protein